MKSMTNLDHIIEKIKNLQTQKSAQQKNMQNSSKIENVQSKYMRHFD